jgi:hypothetical protein
MSIITDINGRQANKKTGIYVTKPGLGMSIDVKPEPTKFIGPSLEGDVYYFSMRRPRSTKEFRAINLRAFRN